MKSLIVKAIIKLCAKSILLTRAIGSVIGLLGFVSDWEPSRAYCDAFFRLSALFGAGTIPIIHLIGKRLSGAEDSLK